MAKGGSFNVFKEEGDEFDSDGVSSSDGKGSSSSEQKKKRQIKIGEAKYGSCADCKQYLCQEYMEVDGKTFHPECFCCFHCKTPFGENPARVKDGKLFCNETCATERTCLKCNKLVSGTVISALARRWHEACFKCSDCGEALTKSFLVRPNFPNSPICDSCGKKVTTAQKTEE